MIPPAPFGIDKVQKFGENNDIDSGTVPEDVWSVGGVYPFPSSAQTTTVVSSDAADSASGAGAQAVVVQGVLSDYSYVSETVATNGTSAVTCTNQFLRVFRVYADTVGTGTTSTNVGIIQVKHGSTVIAQIDAGAGQTLMAIYTVPSDYEKAHFLRWYCDIGKATAAAYIKVVLQQRPFGKAWRDISNAYVVTTGDSEIDHPLVSSTPIMPKADIRLRVVEASTVDLNVSGGFDLALYRKGAV